jgi:hypothetical protein
MIAVLWNILRDTFEPMYCRKCNFKTQFATLLIYHLWKEYKITPTKRDWKFLAKHNFFTRILKSAVALPFFVVAVILKAILFPIYVLYEIL